MNARAADRIVHVITGLAQGGAETALFRLIGGVDHPTDHHVVSLTGEGIFSPRLRELGVTVTSLDMRNPMSAIAAFVSLVRLIRQERPRVVQTWMYHADLFGGIASRLANVPVCWGVRHSNLDSSANKRSTLVVARICAVLSFFIPRYIVSCSGRAIDLHRGFGYSNRFVHIPNGLDLSRYDLGTEARESVRKLLGIDPGTHVLGHVGRLHRQKDYPTLLSAFSALPPAAGVRLLLVGKGLDRETADFTRMKDSGHASIVAMGSRNDVPELLQGMDLFVLSSIGEGFPNVVVEAMASGVPCIVTDVGDCAEIVGDTGWIVPPASPEALGRAMEDALAEDPQRRRARAVAARARISARYTIRNMVRAYELVWAQARSEWAGGEARRTRA